VHGEWLPWIATFTYGGGYHLTRHFASSFSQANN